MTNRNQQKIREQIKGNFKDESEMLISMIRIHPFRNINMILVFIYKNSMSYYIDEIENFSYIKQTFKRYLHQRNR